MLKTLRPALLVLTASLGFLALLFPSRAMANAAVFDRANKLYEQGKFPEAVAAFESFLASNAPTANVWFNLGNAAYKAGQPGRAIAAYRMAERLTPRDPALRANLQFLRSKIYNDERTRVPWWQAAARLGTINEWTILTAACFWILFFALACGEWTKRRYHKTIFVLLTATALSGAGLSAALHDQKYSSEAIVSAREVTVRFGPLDESQSAFQLRDGAEVKVLDSKGDWIQVRDAENRIGWMRRAETIELPGATSRHQPAAP